MCAKKEDFLLNSMLEAEQNGKCNNPDGNSDSNAGNADP